MTTHVSLTGTNIGTMYNPFRYRGYYYDTETGLYYLNSRYYDPDTGRFINIDSALYYSMLGYNMFAYCENNPVSREDDSGQMWQLVPGLDPRCHVFRGGDGVSFHLGSIKKAPPNYDSDAYNSYAIRNNTAAHDGFLGGYHTPSPTTFAAFTNQYMYALYSGTIDEDISYNFNGRKTQSYAEKRLWTDSTIKSALSNGPKGVSVNKGNGNSSCIVYLHPTMPDYYIVIENSSRTVVQVSDLTISNWKLDPEIKLFRN